MSTEFFLRILFMLILAIAGGIWGYDLSKYNPAEAIRYTIGVGLVGALAGLVLTPYFTTRPARAMRSLFGRIAADALCRSGGFGCRAADRCAPVFPTFAPA